MTRSVISFCLLMSPVFPVVAQESTPLDALKLDLNRLKTWGTREYAYEASHPGSPERQRYEAFFPGKIGLFTFGQI